MSHRNICPQSILITSRGLVKLAKFTSCVYGETRFKSSNSANSTQGDVELESILSTLPAVRAPEQLLLLEHIVQHSCSKSIQSNRRLIGASASASFEKSISMHKAADFVIEKAVDVWQLGCCFYALAYGEMPFGEGGLHSDIGSSLATTNIDTINEHIHNRIYRNNKSKDRYSSELAAMIEKLLKVCVTYLSKLICVSGGGLSYLMHFLFSYILLCIVLYI